MKRSKHNLSHNVNQTMNMGMLTPIGLTEVLPGDTWQHATQALIRLAPLNSPVMHPTHAKIMHFFVPHRLVWDEWEDFVTRGADGDSAPVFPTIEFDSIAASSLANYLGLPVFSTEAENVHVSALPFRGYAKIFNEYFRDQDLVDELVIDTSSGVDTTTNINLVPAAWEKDYFTSARPWTQKGPEITIPVSGTAPVHGIALSNTPDAASAQGSSRETPDITRNYTGWSDAQGGFRIEQGATGFPAIYADLSDALGVPIDQLRTALALQRFEEARARYGSRYVEYLRYLGVKSSDARLQRPEYLGGGKQTIQFSEVLQTSPNPTTEDGVGDLFGHGIAAMHSNRYRRFFEEHGYVFSFMVVRPRAIYANGIPRHFNRRTFTDFWQKELEHVGQQAVLNKEVYVGAATPDGTFGYQDQYDEYRRNFDRVGGEFATILNYWTMARIFGSEPTLNDDFVNCIPDPRIFQSTATDQLYVMARHSIQARRLISQSGTSFIL